MSNNQSTINTLRELNSRLASEITELGKENVNIKAENIIKLKQAIEENAMLKIRFEELEKKNKTDTTSILQPSTRSELSAQSIISSETKDEPKCSFYMLKAFRDCLSPLIPNLLHFRVYMASSVWSGYRIRLFTLQKYFR
ncbi:4102_t:CDS:2 [Entrophospora sp. SA101]|nr:4102_t:CDS:2 [Entrophospora sp. SA101]